MDKNIAKSEGAFVNLLNQEIKELQESKKRIEEMARVICGFACDYENCDVCPFNCVNVPCEYHDYAINLINANYHKGKTVSYQAMIDAQNADRWQQGYEQGKRETTEKFAEMARAKARWMRDNHGDYTAVDIDDIDEIVKEFIVE